MVAAALLCALATTAFADNKEAAKQSYTEGKRQYDLGEYDAALAAFKKAYLNYEEPVFLFNIAQCYRALGDRPAAVRTYRAFLRNWPKAPNREQVERIVAELEGAMAQDQTARGAPPQDTLAPPPTAPTERPAVTTTSPPPPSQPQTAPPPAVVTQPPTAAKAKTPPPKDELAGMIEIEPNFTRPSGSVKPLKWWVWTLIAVGIGAVAATAIALAITEGGTESQFKSTLPDFTVQGQALRALQVRF